VLRIFVPLTTGASTAKVAENKSQGNGLAHSGAAVACITARRLRTALLDRRLRRIGVVGRMAAPALRNRSRPLQSVRPNRCSRPTGNEASVQLRAISCAPLFGRANALKPRRELSSVDEATCDHAKAGGRKSESSRMSIGEL